MAKIELYGTATCPHTQEVREWLESTGREFEEFDVEADTEARGRMRTLAGGIHMVPLLIQDGKVIQVGWQGRGCFVD